MIELFTLSKRYGPILAVNQVSLKIEKGECFTLLGPSGCGKTTLLRLIAGFEVPDEGKIFIEGREVSNPKKVEHPSNRHVGMIFQDLALWPHMTVKENIAFGLKGNKMRREDRERKIKKILSTINLEGHLNRYPHQLSGGEKQRLAIARALSLKPHILLLDEPLASLDPLLSKELQKTILNLQKELQITLIYVTHDQRKALT